jgi:RNA polymerase-binding transcription factor DksA
MPRHLDLPKYQRLLEEERTRVTDEIRGIESLDSGESESGEVSELADYDQHQADVATETFMRERDVALEDDAQAILRQVEVALKKIEDGTYGNCERCGKPIPAARLEAIPYTPYDIECAERLSGL